MVLAHYSILHTLEVKVYVWAFKGLPHHSFRTRVCAINVLGDFGKEHLTRDLIRGSVLSDYWRLFTGLLLSMLN